MNYIIFLYKINPRKFTGFLYLHINVHFELHSSNSISHLLMLIIPERWHSLSIGLYNTFLILPPSSSNISGKSSIKCVQDCFIFLSTCSFFVFSKYILFIGVSPNSLYDCVSEANFWLLAEDCVEALYIGNSVLWLINTMSIFLSIILYSVLTAPFAGSASNILRPYTSPCSSVN